MQVTPPHPMRDGSNTVDPWLMINSPPFLVMVDHSSITGLLVVLDSGATPRLERSAASLNCEETRTPRSGLTQVARCPFRRRNTLGTAHIVVHMLSIQ